MTGKTSTFKGTLFRRAGTHEVARLIGDPTPALKGMVKPKVVAELVDRSVPVTERSNEPLSRIRERFAQ